MSKELSISEQLLHSTIRIESEYKNNSNGVGTGFFFQFNYAENARCPVIVTNKHVVSNAQKGSLLFTICDENGYPDFTSKFSWTIEDFEKFWKFHPDQQIDLCVMPIAPLLKGMDEKNKKPFFKCTDKTLIPSEDEFSELFAIEDVVMIGYPIGLWDSANNLPIVRKGITATHPAFKYNNKREFMIDVACFPGSSGSPVFLYNSQGYATKKGNFLGTSRLKLLGILYGGPQYSVNGTIEVANVPTQHVPVTRASIPMNLGCVVNSQVLLDFEEIFKPPTT